jgi:hypothetical protein
MLKQTGSGSGINTPGSDAMPAYAEVDQNHIAALTTFQGHRGCDERCGGPGSSDGSSSPAPYATTTLVGSSRQHLNGLVRAHIPSKLIVSYVQDALRYVSSSKKKIRNVHVGEAVLICEMLYM